MGFLLQSFAPLFSFGSFIVFFVLYQHGKLMRKREGSSDFNQPLPFSSPRNRLPYYGCDRDGDGRDGPLPTSGSWKGVQKLRPSVISFEWMRQSLFRHSRSRVVLHLHQHCLLPLDSSKSAGFHDFHSTLPKRICRRLDVSYSRRSYLW